MNAGTGARASWNASASHLALLRWLLPAAVAEAGRTHDTNASGERTRRIHVPATSPGQNVIEAYGLALVLLLGHTLFFADLLAGTGWASSLRVGAGFCLAFLWLHTNALVAGVLAGWLKRRWGFGTGEPANAFAHRAGFALTTAQALWALAQGYVLSSGPAFLWLAFVTANTWAWFALARWWVLGIFAMAHWSAVLLWIFIGWEFALGLLFVTHMVMLWGLLRPGSELFGPVATRFPTTGREVLLTIDDGPCPSDTIAVLDLLDHAGAKAMFFLIGGRAGAHPRLVEEIVKRGHAIGNHSHRHPRRFFWALPWWRVRSEIDVAQATLSAIVGRAPRWFRSPVGFGNPFLQPLLERRGLRRMGWEVRGFDGVARDPDAVLRRLKAGIRPGSIVLLHQGRPHSLEVLEELLQWLREESFEVVVPNLVEKEP